jgi:prepilin-type N-terminal cleavage/methylation domain-containing protein
MSRPRRNPAADRRAHTPSRPWLRDHRSRGVTLLELLVVLAIIGLLSAIAVPQMATLAARIEFAMNRDKFEADLTSLPYTAYKLRQDFILGALKAEQNPETEGLVAFRTADARRAETARLIEAPILIDPAPISLPQNWKLEARTPVLYRATGVCSGGEVSLNVEGLVYTYQLTAPLCQPVLK